MKEWRGKRPSRSFERTMMATAAFTIAGAFAAPAAMADMSESAIQNCADQNWCAYHRTVDKAWRHSPLKQINKSNVTDLRPAWMFQPGEVRQGFQTTPLVVDGAMYVSSNPSTIWKLDAKTGERIWAYVPDMNEAVVSRTFFPHSRGFAVGGGRVYQGLADGRVVAISDEDGSVVWDKQLVDSAKDTAGFSGGGTYVSEDLFVIGQNGGEYPVEGRIFGLDSKTGEVKWTFYTTGRGDEKALATWGGDSWKYGGGGSWQPGTVDYANNQILIGTGNPNPDYDYCGSDCMDPNADGHRPGANLYTSSTVALDLDTGKLNWYFQEAPSDPYDYDASPGEYVMIKDENGRDLVLHPGKNGFNHVHDRQSGQPVNVYPDMKNYNWTTGFNLETGQWENMLWPQAGEKTLVCPAIDGGHSWNAGTYDPGTGLFYRVANEWCMYLTVGPKGGGANTAGTEERTTEPFAQAFFNAEFEGTNPPNDSTHGRLTARNPVTGELKWEKRYDIIPHSALMSTGGGLLFIGTYDGFLEALDAETGETLWRFNVGSGMNGGIISYAVDGKQYVAAVTGHGSHVGRALAGHYFKDKLVNYNESAALVAFELPN
ncbi:MAG: alcohol dehydrogenase [Rhodospirillaceae bacterium]|nr:alcohol dehydrogenase [Rhodospirillaceae bacterium]